MPRLVLLGIKDAVAQAGVLSTDMAMQPPIEESASLLFIIVLFDSYKHFVLNLNIKVREAFYCYLSLLPEKSKILRRDNSIPKRASKIMLKFGGAEVHVSRLGLPGDLSGGFAE